MSEPRLVIVDAVFHNFKSYYGKKVVGPFHPQFTSVIGPNGSGKSNLFDALLFVFGYRMQKIRQPKLVDLIHRSSKHLNLQKASVEFRFAKVDENNKYIDGSNFSIGREVTASGTSSYFMNGSKSTFTEVTSFLKREGIDLMTGRFLIMQGEVDTISFMKPKAKGKNQIGLLEFIEDIIGSNKFVPDIEAAEASLNEINQKREFLVDKLVASKKDRDALEATKNDAVHYLELKDRLKLVDAKRLHLVKVETENKVKGVNEEIDNMKKEIDEKTQQCNQMNEESQKLKDDYENELKNFKQLSKDYDSKQKELNKEKNQLCSNKMQEKHLREIIEETKTQNEQLETAIKAATVTVTKNQNDIQKNEEKLEEKKNVLPEEKKKLEELEIKVKEESNEIQNQLQIVKDELSQKNNDFINLTTEITKAKNEILAIQQKSKEIILQKEQKQKEYKKTKETIQDLEKKIDESKSQIENNKIENQNLIGKIKDTESLIEKLQQQARTKGRKVAEMRREIEKQARKSHVLKCINEFKNRENIEGIYGRLGDLGTIDPKYDIAISTAGGKRFESIVVDKTETAQRCINEVRRCKAGIVTCIILDKVKELKQRNTKIPKKTLKLIDMLQIKDPKFQPAFYYAIQDTLVAENLYDAKDAAFNYGERHRVVTVDGNLIDISGTFQGGGNQIRRGGMNIVDEDAYRKALKESEETDQRLREAKADLNNYKIQFEGTKTDKLETELQKMKMNLENNKQILKLIEDQLNDFPELVEDKEDNKRIEELQNYLEINEPNYETRKQEVDSLTAKCKLLENNICEIYDTITKEQKTIINNIESEIDKINKKIGILKVKISTSERSITKNQKQKEENDKILAKNEEDILSLSKIIEQSQASKNKLKEETKELSQKVKELEEKTQEMQEKIRNSKSEANEITLAIESIQQDIKKKENNLKDLQKTINGIIKQFEKLGIEENQIDEFQNRTDEELELEKASIEKQLNELDPDLSAIAEYEEKDKIYKSNQEEFLDIDNQRNNAITLFNDLKKQRLDMFLNGFEPIAAKLKETYQLLTLGGDAELEFVDRLDPFSGGISFSVRPAEKSWKKISNLSGGERTISSLSLILSLHNFKPTPFYIMDEVDHALDPRNVSIIANYLKERTTNAQFIVVSHKSNMFENADRLIGVFKIDDCASSLAINTEHRK